MTATSTAEIDVRGSQPVSHGGARARFRSEVQALRAVAVALVVVYHLRPSWVPGGYVGVDVFFVISGFLITGIMAREIESTGRLRLGQFYARRARRILPASAVTILATVAAAVVFLPPTRWLAVGDQALSSALFFQNWALAAESVDYLAQGTAPSPFQHFWSLSIEEQFYFVWPVVLVLLAAAVTSVARPGAFRRAAGGVLLVVTAGSLAASVLVTASGEPSSYFVTHTRAWELGAGGLLALAGTTRRPGSRRMALLSWAGVAAILAGAFTYTDATAFPGVAAALPVVGTMAVIYAGRSMLRWSPRWVVDRRAVQWLGNASYSLYLWHWPVIVILPFVLGDEERTTATSTIIAAVALGLSLACAELSRRYVEAPFMHARSLKRSPRRSLALGAAALTLTVTFSGLPGYALDRDTDEQQAAVAALLADPPPGFGAASVGRTTYEPFAAETTAIVPIPTEARSELPEGAEGRCKSNMGDPFTPMCTFGDPAAGTTVALVGDSHIEQYLPVFQVLAEEHSWRVITFFHSSCPFSTAQRVSDADRGGPCLEANAATLSLLTGMEDLDLVVTSARTAPAFVDDGTRPSPGDGFRQVWAELTGAGLPVAVIADNPLMLPADATNDCVATNAEDPRPCARPREESMPVDHQLAAAADAPGVTLVDLTDRYCTTTECPAVAGNVLVYRDEQHVTPTYMRTLAPALEAVLLGLLP